jgi:hypothetical protein
MVLAKVDIGSLRGVIVIHPMQGRCPTASTAILRCLREKRTRSAHGRTAAAHHGRATAARTQVKPDRTRLAPFLQIEPATRGGPVSASRTSLKGG